MNKCPRCGEMTMDPQGVKVSLSRRDNKTSVCNRCGEDEAFYDFFLQRLREENPSAAARVDIQETMWLTLQMPFNVILGHPYVPLMARKA
jgi:ribosomal protein S27AE